MNRMIGVDHISEKLRQARLATGCSTRVIAERLSPKVKVSHATIANYEAGRSQPTMDVLAVLSAIYGRPLSWFLSKSLTLRNVRYRNRKSRVTQTELSRYEAHAIKWLEAYKALETTLNHPLRADLSDFSFKPGESGKDAAGRLREKMKLKTDQKITSVAELLERLGVRAIELPSDVALDGFAASLGEEYAVVLNSIVTSDRARLNAAHEVGHVLAGDCDAIDIDNEGPNEKRAFEFASHLLLTDEMLKEAFNSKSMVSLVQFKERFGISVAAMIYRGQESGHLSEGLAKRIWIEISRRGWRENEPGYVAEDRSVRFERLLDSALLEERITLDQAATLAGVRTDELRKRHEWALGLVGWRSNPYATSTNKEQPHLRLAY